MQIKDKLVEVGFTPVNSVVIGSGILNALGLRDSNDIDIVASVEEYAKLSMNPRFKVAENHGHEILSDNLFEIGTSWTVIGKTWGFKDLLSHSTVIDGVRYITIEFLLGAKRGWLAEGDVRQKDIDDVKLMEDYLKSHKL
ncbi:MAG TPA: hypothetical protein VMR16_03495 [Candidatus Saccharimonadales bacterium]|nr:hypothetical protein [Candidatus Saccharimonadales bacterium]